MVQKIINIFNRVRLPLQNEKELQDAIEDLFIKNKINYERELPLDKDNIPDFYISGIAIEIKIKGNARKIYKQCERYCQFEKVKQLILLTNRSMGFPQEINGKS